MKLFVPDWDDRVDPGYDFQSDRFSLVRDPYRDDRYAHELFSDPIYDGILVSRMALGEAGPKRKLVEDLGMRKYLRLPDRVELLGDCGAFGYIRDEVPRFETAEVLSYYDRLGFDYGVSVDHLIVTEYAHARQFRYDLTLRNAEDFLKLHRAGDYRFTPIAAIQGWDARSYVEAAQAVVAMGYDYLAIGGVARSNTATVREITSAVVASIPSDVRVHVFGVARLALLPLFVQLRITSVDSAAPIRQAWLSAKDNYYTLSRTYAAIRIPIAKEERGKSGTLVNGSEADLGDLQEAEMDALHAVRAYDRGQLRLDPALNAIMAYDNLLADRAYDATAEKRRKQYHETLRDKPWKHCKCAVCQELGVEVIIFRGNNRNRRRGFHNLWMTRRRLETVRSDPQFARHVGRHQAEPQPLTYPLPL